MPLNTEDTIRFLENLRIDICRDLQKIREELEAIDSALEALREQLYCEDDLK